MRYLYCAGSNCVYCGEPLSSDDPKVTIDMHDKCYDNWVVGKESEEDYKRSELDRIYSGD